MASKTIPIAKATEAELEAFFLGNGQTLDPALTISKMRAQAKMIAGEADEITIEVDDDTPVTAKPARAAKVGMVVGRDGLPEPSSDDPEERDKFMVTVMISRTDAPGGGEPVFLSVNGRGMTVERGVPSRIRWPYYEALRNAIKTEYHMQGEGRDMRPVPVDMPMYPYSRVA